MAHHYEVLSIEEPRRVELPSTPFTRIAYPTTQAVASTAVASVAVASTTAFVSAATSSARVTAASSAPAIDLTDACCRAQGQIDDDDASTVADSESDADNKEMSKARWADLIDSDDEEFLAEADLQIELHSQPCESKPDCSRENYARASWADLVDSDNDGEGFAPRSTPQARSSITGVVTTAAAKEIMPEIRRRGRETAAPKPGHLIAHSCQQQSDNATQSQSQAKNNFPRRKGGRQWEEPARFVNGAGKGARGTSKGKGKGNAGSSAISRGVGEGWNAKLQCQFTVGIEEDFKFRVVKRIIGNGGENMKRIAELTGAKLRLRGRGSKFLEGPEQQESTDGLMLCISSQDKMGYEHAKMLVAELLRNIYHSYDVFSQQSGKSTPAKSLDIQLHEGYREGSR